MVGLIQGPAGNVANSLPSITPSGSGAAALSATPWAVSHTFHELVASTSEAWAGLYVSGWSINNQAILHIAKGASGSEVIFASVHLPWGNTGYPMFVPIAVPAGARISAALSSPYSYNTFYGTIEGVRAADVPAASALTKMECGPFDLSASTAEYLKGPVLDAGATANTKTAWTELSLPAYSGNILQGDSLPYQYKYLGFRSELADGGTTTQSPNFLIDLAYGGVGSEVPFIENFPLRVKSYGTARVIMHDIKWVPWDRPAGDRISARIQCDNITVGERELMFWLYGLR